MTAPIAGARIVLPVARNRPANVANAAGPEGRTLRACLRSPGNRPASVPAGLAELLPVAVLAITWAYRAGPCPGGPGSIENSPAAPRFGRGPSGLRLVAELHRRDLDRLVEVAVAQ